jgi:hypothetical protein
VTAPLAVAALVGAALAALAARPLVRRWRLRRRLARAAAEVGGAMADGRLPRPTGEALLKHLERLRRELGATWRS